MARRVFDSYHAPDSELEGIKAALDEASIPWYETHKGRWWFGSAGIWVSDDGQFALARETIENFQQQWRVNAAKGHERSAIQWRKLPVVILVVGLLVYLTLFWFWL